MTARPIGNAAPSGVDCVAPTPGVSFAGLPARFEREKRAGVGAPAAPAPPVPEPPEGSLPETAALAVNDPAVALAVNGGEVAMPLAPVLALACALPPTKLALAPELEAAAHPPEPPELPEPSVKVTAAPATGAPRASSTLACSDCG